MGRLVRRAGRVVPGEVLDARRLAESLLAAARADADEIRAEARRAGEAAGRAEAEAAFTTLLAQAHLEAERVRAAALPAARALAVRMAEKIVGQAAALDPTLVAAIAARALEAARAGAGTVLLRVHPDDLAAVEAARPALAARLAAAAVLKIVADPTVDRAGCVVDTAAGRLDARLATQLAALERAVFGAAASAGEGMSGVEGERRP